MEETLRFERRFDATPAQVWNALTNPEEMRQWYFDIPGFRAEVGVAFSFWGTGTDGTKFLHLCEVTEAMPERVLAHTWTYEGYEGASTVRWTLEPQGEGTLLRLTHEGLGSFPQHNSNFAINNFREGWTWILHTSLRNHLEPKAV